MIGCTERRDGETMGFASEPGESRCASIKSPEQVSTRLLPAGAPETRKVQKEGSRGRRTEAWAAPRILRWGTKQDSRAERAKKKFVPPLFQMWGTSKQISVGAY